MNDGPPELGGAWALRSGRRCVQQEYGEAREGARVWETEGTSG